MRNVVHILFASVLFLATAGAFSSQASAGNPQAYAALIATHAAANGIPVELAHAVVRHESNYNPRVTGRAGEIGLMQIKLQTARGLGYRGTRQALYEPATNIKWGMIYLGQARRLAGGSECGTLSRYNGGLGTKRIIKSYCRGVMARIPASSRVAIAKAPVKPAFDKVRVASAAGTAPSLFKSLFASAE